MTLYCNITAGNPSKLIQVVWYLNSIILKKCPETVGDYLFDFVCIENDVTALLARNITHQSKGDYYCIGMNIDGGEWSEPSESIHVDVRYRPGEATIKYKPKNVRVGKSVKFSCSVDDNGNPTDIKYKWFRGDVQIPNEDGASLNIANVSSDMQTEYSCLAYNAIGDGDRGTIHLSLDSPPLLIQGLKPITTALFNLTSFSMMCHVQCFPKCSIDWYKNDVKIQNNNALYTIKATPFEGDDNTFFSIESVLVIEISHWPHKKLDKLHDNAKYSCVVNKTEHLYRIRRELTAAVKSETNFKVGCKFEQIALI